MRNESHDIIKQTDPVHPVYYRFGDYDIFDIANGFDLDMELGTALKYICRAGKKSPNTRIQDLRKAIQCIEREIEKYQKKMAKGDNFNCG